MGTWSQLYSAPTSHSQSLPTHMVSEKSGAE
jgi:hypothetical protein